MFQAMEIRILQTTLSLYLVATLLHFL